MSTANSRLRPDAAAAAFLFVVYGATMARGVTFWDAGEFLSAVHSLGIPHPPGTPLFVLLARVWSLLLAPVLGFTIAVNAFSAFCTAVAFGLVANLFWRWTRDTVASFCAAVTAGLMSTVWLNATETEVYACALLGSMLVLWCASRAALTTERRGLVMFAYLCGLGWSLHLTALLSVPAALVLLWPARRMLRARDVAILPAAFLIGASVVLFLLVRAAHDPAVNQGNPVTLAALRDAVQRHQYDVAPMWPRRAPLWLQFGNVFEYADWQFALGLAPDPPPALWRTPFTVLYAVLAVCGSVAHYRQDRASWRAWLIFLLTTSVGVVVYLNLRAGASYGVGVLPSGALHEARDRDYFFTWAFVAWGAWAGVGSVAAMRGVVRSISIIRSEKRMWTAALPVTLALLPCVLNWREIVTERRDQHDAESQARDMLARVPRNGVFLAVGDNDTYPLWYMQQVQSFRRDVVVVTVPLLPPSWYRAELSRRHALVDTSYVTHWFGIPATVAEIRTRAAAQGRAVVESPVSQNR